MHRWPRQARNRNGKNGAVLLDAGTGRQRPSPTSDREVNLEEEYYGDTSRRSAPTQPNVGCAAQRSRAQGSRYRSRAHWFGRGVMCLLGAPGLVPTETTGTAGLNSQDESEDELREEGARDEGCENTRPEVHLTCETSDTRDTEEYLAGEIDTAMAADEGKRGNDTEAATQPVADKSELSEIRGKLERFCTAVKAASWTALRMEERIFAWEEELGRLTEVAQVYLHDSRCRDSIYDAWETMHVLHECEAAREELH